MGRKWRKLVRNGSKSGVTVRLQWGNSVEGWPGPMPRGTTRDRTMSRYPHTRVPHHTTTLYCTTPCSRGRARHRSPGFFQIQSRTQNTDLSKTATFQSVKNRPVKNALFQKNPYLILIVFSRNPVFDVFADFHCFWTPFWTPLVYADFHRFGHLRFSLGF